jgi:Protein of unknown function (DUF3592)
MKPGWLTPGMLRNFEKIKAMGVAVFVLALIPWMAQDFVSSFAATQMTAHTTLRTVSEKDDARVIRAFKSARRNKHVEASLATEQNPQQQTRDALLTITAGSKRETLDGLMDMIAAMKAAFANDGGGELYDIGNTPSALPRPNERMTLLRNACRWAALLILLGGLALMANRLLRSGLPPAAMFAIVAGLSGAALLLFGGGLVWIFALPVLLLVLVTMLTLRVRRAEKWEEGQAHITKSRVTVKRHQFVGEATQVTNKASVAYDFSVGSELFHGNRISLGFGPADEVNVTLKRYPVGATVPVFYDPANPAECVLERKPPVSLECLWGGAIVTLLIYGAVLFSIGRSEALADGLQAALHGAFPRVHHPIVMIVAGLFGLFCLGSWMWNRQHVRKAYPWLVAKGRIVSSETESYLAFDGGHSSSQHRFYRALIEFAYQVDGQEYHNTVGEPGTMRASAEAEAARYVAGTEVDVHYDPQNPTHSALSIDEEMVLDGRASLVVGLISLAVAIYLVLP